MRQTRTAVNNALDAGIEALLHLAPRLPPLNPLSIALAEERRHRVAALVARDRPRVEPLLEGVLAREAGPVARYDALLAGALFDLRAARPGGLAGALFSLDRLLYKNAEELLDDPAFPEPERLHVLATLDRLNTHTGSYQRWSELLGPLLEGAPSPVHLHDLCAGHGGFAIWLKEHQGPLVQVVASDLLPEYLDVGRKQARKRGVQVRFVQQDATDLRGLRDEGVDVFLCTQSLHHFPPGMIARMIGEAARYARRGLCFIDGERGYGTLALVPPLLLAYGRTFPVLHDTVVSIRRMYHAEELLLLAQLAPALPPGARIEAGRCGPGHAYLRVAGG